MCQYITRANDVHKKMALELYDEFRNKPFRHQISFLMALHKDGMDVEARQPDTPRSGTNLFDHIRQ